MSETLDVLVADGAEAYIRYLIAAERAVVQGNFNGAKTLRALAYSHRSIENLTPQEWATTAVMFGGTRSLLDTGTWIANHDRGHVAQIERLLGV